ncbi:MAG: bifunctional adenosylcobinamide kinase/adenosylcobinamide-phosphate guanylyltransferase [Rhodocyclaceae bacterium]
MSRHLILGGARSGKSSFAQARAAEGGGAVHVIVTAEAWDDEMRQRIALHQQARPPHWHTREAPHDLPAAVREASAPGRRVLVDCVTLWLSNVLCTTPDALDDACDALVAAVAHASGELFIVSNETGWGIVPDNALARRFRDDAGRLNQRLAQACDTVTLIVAGLPLPLKTAH